METENKTTNPIFCNDCINGENPIFAPLNSKEKEMLQSAHTQKFYRRGEIIYHKGDVPRGLMCLTSGKVKVLKQGICRGQIIRITNPYGFIGYRALFAGEKYTSSAIAIEDCSICTIAKKNLFYVIRKNGRFGLNLLGEMAQELGFSNERTVNLTQKHTRGRLAESLLFMTDIFGFESDKKTINAYLSRQDIASLSSMTTSNAIRTLSAFADEDIISLEGKKIKILDINKLKKIDRLG